MIYQIIEDSQLAKRNQSLVLGCGGTIAYNAVLSTVFSGESTTEPVTLDEAKNWCRIDVTDDDTLIEDIIIPAAREVCENYANLSFIARTVTAKIQNGLGNFYLPYGPVVAITAATDYNLNNIFTDFSLDTVYPQPITVVYTAGYADGTLPKNLKTAVLCQIAWIYENRGDLTVGPGVSDLSKLLLNQVRNV